MGIQRDVIVTEHFKKGTDDKVQRIVIGGGTRRKAWRVEVTGEHLEKSQVDVRTRTVTR